MRLYAAKATLILGKKRKNGLRRVLAARLVDWSPIATALHTQEIPVVTGETGKLYIHLSEPYQQVFLFLSEDFPGEASPVHRIERRKRATRLHRVAPSRNGGTR
jgi:hypothetical protein